MLAFSLDTDMKQLSGLFDSVYGNTSNYEGSPVKPKFKAEVLISYEEEPENNSVRFHIDFHKIKPL